MLFCLKPNIIIKIIKIIVLIFAQLKYYAYFYRELIHNQMNTQPTFTKKELSEMILRQFPESKFPDRIKRKMFDGLIALPDIELINEFKISTGRDVMKINSYTFVLQ